MTVLPRGARVRRGGRRPGWVLLTTLLVLAIGASSALVFTNRVELLKLAVILALWAAVAGAFVSMMYRRQAEVDQARARDMKLVYDLQLDREISARREYELTVESQLRRELAYELRGAAADEVAALRAELSALRTNLEILFDADLAHRPALETLGRDGGAARILTERGQNGAQHGENPPADWVASDRVTAVREGGPGEAADRADDAAIIDVPEVGVLPPDEQVLVPPAPREPAGERLGMRFGAAPPPSEPLYQPRHHQPVPPPPPPPMPPPPQRSEWQPAPAGGQWLPPGAPGSHWAPTDAAPPPPQAPAPPSGRRRRARHFGPEGAGLDGQPGPLGHGEPEPQYGGGRRSRSRHSAEYRDYGIGALAGPAEPPPPRLAPPRAPDPAPRHRSEDAPDDSDELAEPTGGQSVADLLARLQVQPSGGGKRRRRDG